MLLILVVGCYLQACSSSSTEGTGGIIFDQAGTLLWSGPPAADGGGMLFKAEDETYYGLPGTKEDYTNCFPGDENQVEIVADIRLTGRTTVRGWGTEYPAITFIDIKKVEQAN
jgi:hypothetical protein